MIYFYRFNSGRQVIQGNSLFAVFVEVHDSTDSIECLFYKAILINRKELNRMSGYSDKTIFYLIIIIYF